MMKLLGLIAKNFKLLLRSKTSALIIFVGPLLLVSLLGLAYSHSSAFTLTASIYSDSYSDLSESLVKKMQNQNFNVLRQANLDNCINSVKRAEAQACILFPKGMSLENAENNQVTFYVDYSQVNLVWMILDVMEARVSEKSSEISRDLTRDLLDRLWFVQDKVNEGNEKLKTLKSGAGLIQQASTGAKTNVGNLDVNVSFDVTVADAKSQSEQILLTFSDIKTDVESAVEKVSLSAENIQDAAADVEDEVNSTSINESLTTIDTQIDTIKTEMSDLRTGTDNNNQELVDKIGAIQTSLNAIVSSVEMAQSQLTTVKKSRDDLIPQFDNLNKEVDGLVSGLNTLQGTLDEALQKMHAIKATSPDNIASPITTNIRPISSQPTHFNSLFPVLLVLIIMITGILLGSALVIEEKRTKAFFRNNIVPTSYFTFSLATYLTALSVLAVQLILFISVAAFFFETEVLASIWLVLLIVFLVSTLFIVVGMFLGFLFRTEATATLGSITLAAIFLLFSSTVIPSAGLTEIVRKIVSFNPFVISEQALRQTILFNFGFDKLMYSLGLLAGYAIGVFVLLLLLQDVLRRLVFLQKKKVEKPLIVKEKKAEKKLAPEEPKVDNAADELLVNNKE